MLRINAVLLDAPGTLYNRPAVGVAFQTLLDHYGLKPRHPRVVYSAMRAAIFDADMGRISENDYHNAILKVHGLTGDQALAAGREALRFDASRLEIQPGTVETLEQLREAQIRVAVIANTPYHGEEELSWLERVGVSPSLFTAYLCSCDLGAIAPDPFIMNMALHQLQSDPSETVLVSQDDTILAFGSDNGLVPIAFQVENSPFAQAQIVSLSQLAALVDG